MGQLQALAQRVEQAAIGALGSDLGQLGFGIEVADQHLEWLAKQLAAEIIETGGAPRRIDHRSGG